MPVRAGKPGLCRAAIAALALAVAGCGGASDANSVRTTFANFYAALVKHQPQAACDAITNAFWQGFRQDLAGRLPGQVPPTTCVAGMAYLFRLEGRTPATSSPKLSSIRVNGSTATARLQGPVHTPVEFTRVGGVWRLNCCTGSQLAERPSTTYRIPSGSMEPTLRIGQIVTADDAAMRAHPPAIGDIVVFHPPAGADAAAAVCGARNQGMGHRQACDAPTAKESVQTFIKRVVAGPGDRISIVNGRVIRNGVREQAPYVNGCSGAPCNFPKPIVLPQGEYYVLGDNREASYDSRFWGPIKRAWIIGLVKP